MSEFQYLNNLLIELSSYAKEIVYEKDRSGYTKLYYDADTLSHNDYIQKLTFLKSSRLGQKKAIFEKHMLELISLYRESNEKSRQFIRDFCSEDIGIVLAYFGLIRYLSPLIVSPGDTRLLYDLLTGYSVLDRGNNLVFYNYYIDFEILVRRAIAAAIPVIDIIKAVRDVSSDQLRTEMPANLSTRAFFTEYHVIKELGNSPKDEANQ